MSDDDEMREAQCQHGWQSMLPVLQRKCIHCGIGFMDWQWQEFIPKLIQAIEDADRKAIQVSDQDGFVSLYKFPTGPWHKILGIARQLEKP